MSFDSGVSFLGAESTLHSDTNPPFNLQSLLQRVPAYPYTPQKHPQSPWQKEPIPETAHVMFSYPWQRDFMERQYIYKCAQQEWNYRQQEQMQQEQAQMLYRDYGHRAQQAIYLPQSYVNMQVQQSVAYHGNEHYYPMNGQMMAGSMMSNGAAAMPNMF